MAAPQIIEQPRYARRNDYGHYTWEGVALPSVTTILDIASGGHLSPWYAKMTAVECAELLDKRDAGLFSAKECDDMIRDWQTRMTAAIRYRDYKAAIGSLTHHAIYERALGVSVPDDLQEYLEGWAVKLDLAQEEPKGDESEPYARTLAKAAVPYTLSAYAWLDKDKPDFEAVGQEAVVISLTHGYAGTVDAIATIAGVRRTIDFKTSNSLDMKKVPMQLEAYRNADFIGLVADQSEHHVDLTDGIAALHIRPDAPSVLRTWEPSEEVFEGFLALRQVYGLLNDMPKPNAIIRAKKAAAPREKKTCPF